MLIFWIFLYIRKELIFQQIHHFVSSQLKNFLFYFIFNYPFYIFYRFINIKNAITYWIINRINFIFVFINFYFVTFFFYFQIQISFLFKIIELTWFPKVIIIFGLIIFISLDNKSRYFFSTLHQAMVLHLFEYIYLN